MLHENVEYALTGADVDEVEVTVTDIDVLGRIFGAVAVLQRSGCYACDCVMPFANPSSLAS
jgi:hypothetical protein